MAWQVIGISNPAKLSTRDNQLIITQEQETSVPLEDIDALIIDTYATCTSKLLTALPNTGTTVIICDEKHLPASILLPYSQHSRQAKVSRQQIAMSQPLKKQLWQRIIIQKITNQADVLNYFDQDDILLRQYTGEIKSGDSTNRESLAARIYFAKLLGDATRRKPLWHNAALNYGYAMVRSHIARHVAARGLIASEGIFHRSELNSLNLADDIIEPYRPAVDKFILSEVAPFHTGEPDIALSKQDRQAIVDILNYHVILNNKKFTIKHAVERTVESFVDGIESKEASRLLLPSIITS